MQEEVTATAGEKLHIELSDPRYAPLAQRWYGLISAWLTATLRLRKPVPLIVCAFIVICATLLVGLLITLLSPTPQSFSPNVLLIQLWVTLFAALIQVIIHTYAAQVSACLRTGVVPAITRDSDLDNLRGWLRQVNRLRPQLAFSITIALAAAIITLVGVSSIAGGFVGIGAGAVFFISFVQIASAAYIPILDIGLFNRLPHYQFRIYAPNPSQSPAVQAIYGLTTSPSLSFSVMLTLLSFIVSLMVEEQRWIISLVVLVGWMPLIAAFTQSQRSLGRIIQRAKEAVLADIAVRVHRLSQQLDQQNARSEMQWFMEYHDRIVRTPNSLIDLRSVLRFSFSLLLPLIVVALQVLVTELLKRVL